MLGLTVAIGLALVAAPALADPTDACLQASDEGQVLRDKGQLLAARARFLACARPECPTVVRGDCAGWLVDVDARTPSVVVSAQDPGGRDTAEVKVTMDGVPFLARLDGKAIPVDPGEHRFRFELAGSAPVDGQAIVREGERRRVITARFGARSGPLPPPSSEPQAGGIPTAHLAAALALGGVALAGGGVFAYFGVTAKSDADHLRATCAPNCKQGDVDAVRTKEIVANVSLGVGIAAVAAAAVVLIVRPSAARAAPAVVRIEVRPAVGGGVAGIGGRF
jgi:hypothetical protein